MIDAISSFLPQMPSESLLGSSCKVIVSTRAKTCGVSLLDKGWDLGLPWGHQRPTQGVLEATSSFQPNMVSHFSSQQWL